jgi:hypothetical protein
VQKAGSTALAISLPASSRAAAPAPAPASSRAIAASTSRPDETRSGAIFRPGGVRSDHAWMACSNSPAASWKPCLLCEIVAPINAQ